MGFILYVRKYLKNPLMCRNQLSVDLIHPGMANVPKSEIKEKLAKVMKVKEEAITVFGLKNKYGGGRSTGFALIYENLDKKKKYDTKTGLRRDKLAGKRNPTRKAYKEIKGRRNKVKGTQKAKVTAGGKKKR